MTNRNWHCFFLRIGHNNAGIGAGWHLKEVLVESVPDGRKWLCECNNWLAKDEADGKIERELPAIEIRPDAERFGFKCPQRPGSTNKHNGIDFSNQFKTI